MLKPQNATYQVVKREYNGIKWYLSLLIFFSSSIYCAPSVAREQTAYEERIPSKAHSPSGKVLWVYWARWLWTPGLFQCRALMWHYNLKLLILHVQNFATICNNDLSRMGLLEHPSTKISDHPGRLCKAYMPNLKCTLPSIFRSSNGF